MDLEQRIRELEAGATKLARTNRRLARGGLVGLALIGVMLVGGASDNAITTNRIVLKDAKGRVRAQIVPFASEGEGPQVGGIAFQDAKGITRARMQWSDPLAEFAIYTAKGEVIQAMPLD